LNVSASKGWATLAHSQNPTASVAILPKVSAPWRSHCSTRRLKKADGTETAEFSFIVAPPLPGPQASPLSGRGYSRNFGRRINLAGFLCPPPPSKSTFSLSAPEFLRGSRLKLCPGAAEIPPTAEFPGAAVQPHQRGFTGRAQAIRDPNERPLAKTGRGVGPDTGR
jgi:hypothetical protein